MNCISDACLYLSYFGMFIATNAGHNRLGGSVAEWLGRWLVIERSRVRLRASTLPSNNSGQVVHTHVPLSPSSITWYRPKGVTLCSWEGNRRSGVALAMRHRLSGLFTYGPNGQCLGDEHLA